MNPALARPKPVTRDTSHAYYWVQLVSHPLTQKYNGYAVCPFTVSGSTAVFAEFDADYQPMLTIPKVPTWKESRASWVVDRDIFPQVYWKLILKGRA